jgi:tetratricopeptide (TPR) repeat protein
MVVMSRTREELETQNLDELFERFRQSPEGYAFVPLADACRKMGRIEEALEICDAGVKRHPAYASGHVVRGKCLYDGGNRVGAREAFDRVLLLDEHNLVALKFLGMIEADDGDLESAGKHLKRILSFDPENKEIKSILHLVEEQAQIERAAEEPVATMDAVDELLAGAAPTSTPEEDDEDEPAPALSIEADLGSPARGAAPGDDVETSDELASVTLADIFAEQGYTSKAAKIYREVLRKQPANDAIRAKLAELTGESVETDEPEKGPVSGEPSGLPEIGGSVLSTGFVPETPVEAKRTDEPATAAPPVPEADADSDGESAEFAESEAEAEAEAEAVARLSGYPRAEIAEKESLGHFRHWLTKLRG